MTDSDPNKPIPVILNPKARSERASAISDQVAALSSRIEIHETQHRRDAKAMARSLAATGHPLIVAAGGDGTINEVVSGIAAVQEERGGEAHPTLGILPMGTMNVFARELGIPCRDLPAAWAAICSGQHAQIDLWRANSNLFVQMAGVGIDAEIVRRTTWQSKKRFGPCSYLLTALRMVRRPAPKLRVEIPGRDDDDSPRDGSAVIIGNGRLYGGPFSFLPAANNRDGELDLVLFRKLNAAVLLKLGMALVRKRRCSSSPHVHYERAEEFTVTSQDAEAHAFEVDGEYVGHTPVHVRKAEFPLRIAIPSDPDSPARPDAGPPRQELADEHFSP